MTWVFVWDSSEKSTEFYLFNFSLLQSFRQYLSVFPLFKPGCKVTRGWCGCLFSVLLEFLLVFLLFGRNIPPISIFLALSRSSAILFINFIVFWRRILLERSLLSMILLSYLKRFWSRLDYLPDSRYSHYNRNGISLEWDHSYSVLYGHSFLLASSWYSSLIMGIINSNLRLIQNCRSCLFRYWGFDILSLYHLWHVQYL